MPTYNYKCSKCGNIFDIEATLQEKKEGNKKFACPSCGAKEINQKLSGVAFMQSVFKDSEGGCCSDKDVCDIRCRPNENNPNGCGDEKGGSGCC